MKLLKKLAAAAMAAAMSLSMLTACGGGGAAVTDNGFSTSKTAKFFSTGMATTVVDVEGEAAPIYTNGTNTLLETGYYTILKTKGSDKYYIGVKGYSSDTVYYELTIEQVKELLKLYKGSDLTSSKVDTIADLINTFSVVLAPSTDNVSSVTITSSKITFKDRDGNPVSSTEYYTEAIIFTNGKDADYLFNDDDSLHKVWVGSRSYKVETNFDASKLNKPSTYYTYEDVMKDYEAYQQQQSQKDAA